MEPNATYLRFFEKVAGKDACWEWTAAKNWKGYGVSSRDGVYKMAHRFAYELLIGPIPDGLQLDHLCRNRACVNPNHLEPVTVKENLARGRNLMLEKTHCKRGHVFDEANTRWVTTKIGNPGRSCRRCEKIHSAAYRARLAQRANSSVDAKAPPTPQ